MNAGDVFRFSGIADIHAWVIISDPGIDPSKVLWVSFTTYDPRSDQACILDKGDHPFIEGRTCVEYGRAKVTTDDELNFLYRAKRLLLMDPVRPEILARLRRGAMQSDRIRLSVRQILIEQGLVDEF